MNTVESMPFIYDGDLRKAEDYCKWLNKPHICFDFPEDPNDIDEERIKRAGRMARVMIHHAQYILKKGEHKAPYTNAVIKDLIHDTLQPFMQKYVLESVEGVSRLQFVVDLAHLREARAKAAEDLQTIVNAKCPASNLDAMNRLERRLDYNARARRIRQCSGMRESSSALISAPSRGSSRQLAQAE